MRSEEERWAHKPYKHWALFDNLVNSPYNIGLIVPSWDAGAYLRHKSFRDKNTSLTSKNTISKLKFPYDHKQFPISI